MRSMQKNKQSKKKKARNGSRQSQNKQEARSATLKNRQKIKTKKKKLQGKTVSGKAAQETKQSKTVSPQKNGDLGKKRSKRKQSFRNKWLRRWKKQRQRLIKELSISLFLFFLVLLTVQQLTFSVPKMVGYSMMSTVNDSDRLFVNKLGELKRFQLVYYRDSETGDTSVRRIVGLPEERIRYIDDQLYVNDQPVVERFLEPVLNELQTNTAYTEDFTLDQIGLGNQIPKDCYFLLGDNRPFAADSRTFGFVKKENILGVVEMRIWPLHELKRY